MFDKIYTAYYKAAKINVLTFLLLGCIGFAAFVLKWVESQIKGFSGGIGPIDLLFSYSCEQVYQMLKAYNGEGREFYAIVELTVGIVNPVIFSLFLSLLIIFLCKKLYIHERVVKIAFLVPVIALAADFLENLSITVMLLNYPYKLNTIAKAANIFTMIKWLFLATSLLLILTILFLFAIRLVKYRFTYKSRTVSR